MNDKRIIVDTLIGLVQKGEDISHIVGHDLAIKITEIATIDDITLFEAQLSKVMMDLDIKEEDLNLKKTFDQMDLEDELTKMKKKLGK